MSVTSVPGSRDARRRETISRFGPLKSLPRKFIKMWSMCHCFTAISPPENQSVTRTNAVLAMLPIVSLTPSIAATAALACLIATVGVSSKFGVLGRKYYQERIWLQALKATLTLGKCIPGVSPGGGGACRRGMVFSARLYYPPLNCIISTPSYFRISLPKRLWRTAEGFHFPEVSMTTCHGLTFGRIQRVSRC